MAGFARFIEQETEFFVEGKDAENTEKVREGIDKCSRYYPKVKKVSKPE